MYDLGYATRALRREPGLVAVVCLTLALGIGANAIMFAIVDRMLLRPPAHVREPDRVVRIYFREKAPSLLPGQDSITSQVSSYPALMALARTGAFAQVAGISGQTVALGRGADAREVNVALVSADFFSLLGTRPMLGRFFVSGEDEPGEGAPVAVASHRFWRRELGEGGDAVGRELVLDGRTFTVIGVAPRGFAGVDLSEPDVWVPVSAFAASHSGPNWRTEPNSWWISGIARLVPGATPVQASAEATTIYRNLVRSWGQSWRDTMPRVIAGPLLQARGPVERQGEVTVSVWLIGVAAIVLLIACANVANLLLGRAVRRRREIAVRLALGAGASRLVRQLIIESLLLASLAGAVALLIAHWGGEAVRTVFLPAVAWSQSPVDMRVLAFTALATVLTTVLAGLAPALQASRTDIAGALTTGGRDGGRRSRARTALLVAQASLCVVLLIGAGLFVRSLQRMRSTNVGVDLDRVVLVVPNARGSSVSAARRGELFDMALERLRRTPIVERAATVAGTVPRRGAAAYSIAIAGVDSVPTLPNGGPYYSAVGADYFATLGARIIRGRGITAEDVATRARVMVVNATFARHAWSGGSPIGACVRFSVGAGSLGPCTEVVGVVEDVMLFKMIGDERSQLYLPATHPIVAERAPDALVVRLRGDAERLAPAVRRIVQSAAADMPLVSASSFERMVAPDLRPWRLGATMFSIFGALALVIAAVGLYSVIAYGVAQRLHEMGVRMALGARESHIVRLVLAEGARALALGIALGSIVALGAGRWVAPLLYRTSPYETSILVAVALVLGMVGLIACAVPAWRATRVDPAVALRAE